jgi:small subunit ribosomal protein S20
VSDIKHGNKAARAAERKRIRNRLVRRSLKTYLVKAKAAADTGAQSAQKATITAVSNVDRAVSKSIIHRNKGARLKSSLMRALNKEQGTTG